METWEATVRPHPSPLPHSPPQGGSSNGERVGALLFQSCNSIFHFDEMRVGVHGVGHVCDFSIQPNEKASAVSLE
jgi:hypothetical protein